MVNSALATARWWRLIPVVFVTYSLAYLDRSNFSIAAAGGMAADLQLTPAMSGLVGAAFFLGYFLFQVPGVLFADRRGVRTLIFWSVLAWGLLASVQGLLSSTTALVVVRFLLGAVEAAVLPALVVLLSRWFTKAERGTANALLILGNPVTILWLSAASGYLIEATSWRAMFIIEGLPAVLWAFVFAYVVRDRPVQAPWLTVAERTELEAAIEAERPSTTQPRARVAEALRDRRVVLLAAQYLLWSIGVYGFVFWLPSIVRAGSSAGIGAVGLLSAVPYVFAVAVMVLNSRRSDRQGRRSRFVWPWLLLGAVAFYGSYSLVGKSFWLGFVMLLIAGVGMYAPYGPFFAMISEVLPRRVAVIATAVVNAFGGLGGFLGTYLVGWLQEITGTTAAAFLMLSLTMAAAAALALPLSRVRSAGDGSVVEEQECRA